MTTLYWRISLLPLWPNLGRATPHGRGTICNVSVYVQQFQFLLELRLSQDEALEMKMIMYQGPRWDKQRYVVHATISKSVFRTFEFGNNYLLCHSVLLAIGHALTDANLFIWWYYPPLIFMRTMTGLSLTLSTGTYGAALLSYGTTA